MRVSAATVHGGPTVKFQITALTGGAHIKLPSLRTWIEELLDPQIEKVQAEFESRAKKAKLAGKFESWNNTLSLSGFGNEKASSRPPTPEKRETTGRFLEACANFLNVRIMFLDTKPTSLGDSIWKHLREAVSIHATSFRLRPATRQPCMTMTQRHASKQASGKESGRQMSTQPEKYSPTSGLMYFPGLCPRSFIRSWYSVEKRIWLAKSWHTATTLKQTRKNLACQCCRIKINFPQSKEIHPYINNSSLNFGRSCITDYLDQFWDTSQLGALTLTARFDTSFSAAWYVPLKHPAANKRWQIATISLETRQPIPGG